MKGVWTVLLVTVGVCGGGSAYAQVYRCTAADGAVSFQDRVCATGQRQSLVDVPSHGPPGYVPPPVATAAPPASAAALPPPYVPPAALPVMYACVGAVNGKHYLTSAPPGPYLAPLGVMGYPPMSLSEAYGGLGAHHESPPALAPKVRTVGPSLAAGMTEVEDRCQPASRAEVCGVIAKQYADNQRELNFAMPSAAPPLRQRAQQLEDQLRNCR